MSGRQVASCRGAQYAMEPSSWIDACFVRQPALPAGPSAGGGPDAPGPARSRSPSHAARSEGSTSFTPCADSCAMMLRAAPLADSRTGTEASEQRDRSVGSSATTYGSNRRPSREASAARHQSAPSFAAAADRPSHISRSDPTTSSALSEPMPRPFTSAATPSAAPRRAP